jgi:hemoglobin
MTVKPGDTPESSSLYERLGGRGGIAVIVELWCDRVLADPQLASHFAGCDVNALKQQQAESLVDLVGGHCRQPAQPLPPLQARVPPSGWHAERLISHLIAALVWASVPRATMEEVLEAVAPLSPNVRPARPPARDREPPA